VSKLSAFCIIQRHQFAKVPQKAYLKYRFYKGYITFDYMYQALRNSLCVWLFLLCLDSGRMVAQNVRPTGILDFNLAGEAQILDEQCLQLTPALDWASGSAWYKESIDMNGSFHMEMDLMMGCDDADGADGLVFVFTPFQGAIGYRGEGMGFAGLRPSLGIEVDTWENEHLGDPAQDHVALLQHGYVQHFYNLQGPIPIPNVEDCKLHRFSIHWVRDKNLLTVLLDGVEVLNHTQDLVKEIFFGQSKLYWGVTAATGRYNNEHQICFRKLDFSVPIDMFTFHPREAKLLLRGTSTPLEIGYSKGNYALDRDELGEINKVINLLKEHPHHQISIEGHSDEFSSPAANKLLSTQRVKTIADYLVKHGIKMDRINMEGLGESYPIKDDDRGANPFMKNTRIEIRIFNPRT